MLRNDKIFIDNFMSADDNSIVKTLKVQISLYPINAPWNSVSVTSGRLSLLVCRTVPGHLY